MCTSLLFLHSSLQRLVTLESLTSYSLPDSHLSLLHSSAQLRKSKKSHRVILNDLRLRDHLRALSKSKKQTGSVTDDTDDEDATVSDVASLVGTSWKSQVENGGGADEFSSGMSYLGNNRLHLCAVHSKVTYLHILLTTKATSFYWFGKLLSLF